MAKKKSYGKGSVNDMNKKKKKEKQAELAWNRVRNTLESDPDLCLTGEVIEDLHRILRAAVTIFYEIGKLSDSIKLGGFDAASNYIDGIDRKTFLDFVRVAVSKNNGGLMNKTVESFNKDIKSKYFIANLRKSFWNTYMENDTDELEILSNDSSVSAELTGKGEVSTEFNKILNDCARTRYYLNNVLWPQYKDLADAAYHLTKGRMTYDEFKDLSDWEYWICEDTASEERGYWIFYKFNRMIRLMREYSFSDRLNELLDEFGLEVTVKKENPKFHTWGKKSPEKNAGLYYDNYEGPTSPIRNF